MSKLITAILTKNEALHIGACLATVQWTDGVLIQDHFSGDETVTIAKKLGARVFQEQFINFSIARNNALKHAVELGAEWLLFVDADERITPELAHEIREAISQPDTVGWWVPRYNLMWGNKMRGGGWYPDHQLRLLKIEHAHYDPQRQVHELAELNGPVGYLNEHIVHYNYASLAQFRHKQRNYTNFEAEILHQQGIKAKPWTYLTMPAREFYWRYIKWKGYRDGWLGVQLCILMAWYKFLTYWRLRQLG